MSNNYSAPNATLVETPTLNPPFPPPRALPVLELLCMSLSLPMLLEAFPSTWYGLLVPGPCANAGHCS